MDTKMLIGQLLMLLMMSHISSCQYHENLECYTDLLDVITCVWNSSSVEDRFNITPTTKCYLKSKYNDYITIQTPHSILEPLGSSQTKLRQGTIHFSEESLSRGSIFTDLFVWCENKTNPVETKRFYGMDNVKLYPPERPLVEGVNVTWKRGSPQSFFVNKVKYEVQWRTVLKNSWKMDITEEERYELPEKKLILGRQYLVRVRAMPLSEQRFWSEWSPVTQWKATVGSQDDNPSDRILDVFTNFISIVVFVAVAVILLLFVCILRYRRIMKCPYVPTPGKYFGNLFSHHGGDFKSWLGPIVNPEMYIKVDIECISPLTIYKPRNSDMLSSKMEKDGSISNGNSSFSNSTYFQSQSSKSAILGQLEPCSADCPYGPAAGGSVQEKILPAAHDNGHDNELSEVGMSTPLETSSSYKQLQKLRLDIQSPDSGFAGSSEEQESQEESGSEGLPSPPVVDSTLPISCILACPVPKQIGFPLLGMLPGQAWNQWNRQTFTNLPSDISRNILLANSGIVACSGILEPSSDDYMPVKKVEG